MDRRLFLAALPLLAGACTIEDERDHPDASPTAPSPPPAPPKVHDFEFRVTGTLRGVDVALNSTAEGTTSITTDLPWFATVRSTRTSMFLSLAAQGLGFGTLTVQLFVDGQLFREATSSGFDPRAAISGQWAA